MVTGAGPDEDRFAPDLLKALKESGAPIPQDLAALAAAFMEKVKSGAEKVSGRRGRRGGGGLCVCVGGRGGGGVTGSGRSGRAHARVLTGDADDVAAGLQGCGYTHTCIRALCTCMPYAHICVWCAAKASLSWALVGAVRAASSPCAVLSVLCAERVLCF